ncbi:7SK snRNA methylphosphate capping enzyme [Erpetoichthys calabaricus]|uniref:RNA methyltransferase n=1 Tax=Erpetoichthys calabaricus TaxID=27687 RepID=A0A8C4S4X7_ERPCA|nr:7SK snRNA methylphosphate capping enzyme [Erpetoichthys calabaricus]
MIEMSVENNTSVEGNADSATSLHQCTGNSPSHVPLPVESISGELMDDANVVLTARCINNSNSIENKVEHVEAENTMGQLYRPKNGLQQQQKSNKRRNSVNIGFKHPGFKRRRRANSECDPVLPTNFLLGGNIFDPLNLNSLLDEEVNRALNAETPKSSPLPSKNRDPVEILIPKDITDPLNLNCGGGDDGILVSPVKAGGGGRKRHRHRHHGNPPHQLPGSVTNNVPPIATSTQESVLALNSHSLDVSVGEKSSSDAACPILNPPYLKEESMIGSAVDLAGETPPSFEGPQPYELNTSINCRDEIVPPILPMSSVTDQKASSNLNSSLSSVPGGSVTCASVRHRKRRRTSSKSESVPPIGGSSKSKQAITDKKETPEKSKPQQGSKQYGSQPLFKDKQRKFQYGNYNKYYGYRNPGWCEDPRVRVLKPEWFHDKSVLDLGCNTGHMTLYLAKNCKPCKIVGIDIDTGLIHSAWQNVRHYLSEVVQPSSAKKGEDHEGTPKKQFPASLTICRGPIAPPPIGQLSSSSREFPNNVSFLRANYVLPNDDLLQTQRPEYDVILCLSMTKWVHLNWGDDGLKRLFRRIYLHLNPGGVLILEPQPWSSYGKRKKITENINKNYYNIHFKPDQFTAYLISPEVGFSSYELIGTPQSSSKGFQRPIYLFHKGHPSTEK